MSAPNTAPDIKTRITELTLKDSVERAVPLSYLLAVFWTLYAFNSTKFFQRFNPDVTLWNNTWPRIFSGTLPLLMLGVFMKKSRLGDRAKLLIWVSAFSTVYHGTNWIQTWPLALQAQGRDSHLHATCDGFSDCDRLRGNCPSGAGLVEIYRAPRFTLNGSSVGGCSLFR